MTAWPLLAPRQIAPEGHSHATSPCGAAWGFAGPASQADLPYGPFCFSISFRGSPIFPCLSSQTLESFSTLLFLSYHTSNPLVKSLSFAFKSLHHHLHEWLGCQTGLPVSKFVLLKSVLHEAANAIVWKCSHFTLLLSALPRGTLHLGGNRSVQGLQDPTDSDPGSC